MAEETTTTEEATAAPQAQEQPTETEQRTYTQSDLDRKFNEMTRRLKSYQDKEEADKAARAQAEKQQAMKKGELEKVIEQVEAEKQQIASDFEKYKLEALAERLDSELRMEGIQSEEERIGFRVKYFQLEEAPPISDWIAQLKEQRPDKFTAPRSSVRNAPVGGVKQSGSSDSLEARLRSEDPATRQAARNEMFKKTMTGEA